MGVWRGQVVRVVHKLVPVHGFLNSPGPPPFAVHDSFTAHHSPLRLNAHVQLHTQRIQQLGQCGNRRVPAAPLDIAQRMQGDTTQLA